MTKQYNGFKRILACVLAFAVLISVLALNFTVTANNSDTFYEGIKGVVWNGQIATKYAGGSGTQSDPYLIETPNQLAYLIKHDIETVDGGTKNKYYKLTANIYLNDVFNANWKNDEPNSWIATASGARFKGHLDGDGYTVYGLYFSGSGNIGLLSYADVWYNDVSIKNLTISDSSITTAGNYAGAFIGFAYSSINANTLTFENCYVTDSVTISSPSGGGTTGGLIGYAQKCKVNIKNCAAIASLSGKVAAGLTGGFGNSAETVAEDCFIVGTTLGAGLGTKTDCYVITDKETIKGDAAKTAMPDLDWENVWTTGENAPVLKNTKPSFTAWDGTIAESFLAGDGTQDNPYIITDGSQLALMITSGDDTKDKYYQLGANIYLNDTTDENWMENNPKQWYSYTTAGKKYFQGNFDGDGKTIHGLYYKGQDSIVAVIPAIKGTVNITDLSVADAYVESSGYALAAIGAFLGGGTITATKCYVYDSVTVKCTNTTNDNSAGGIFGYGKGTITVKDSAVLAERSSTGNSNGSYSGAIVANSWSSKVTVENTFALGTFGKNPGTVNCINSYSSVADTNYNSSVCAQDKMIGFDAETNMPSLDWAGVWDAVEGSYPVIGLPEAEAGKVWDGTVAERFSGGNGTAQNPYVILTAEQLARMIVNNGGKEQHYVLGADILLNDVTAENWTENSPNSWYTYAELNKVAFVGTLDGAGHTVYGLYFNGSGTTALFPCAADTTIKNLVISDAYLETVGSVAALIAVGRNKLTVKQCYIDETVEIVGKGAENAEGTSGFIAYGSPTFTIESCAFLGKITASTDLGAFAGFTWGNASNRVVKDSFAIGVPLCGEKPFTAENCYNTLDEVQTVTGKVTKLDSAALMQGTAAKANMPDLNWKVCWKVTDGYPECHFDGDLGTPGEVWMGGIARAYSGGKGTKDDPYLVATGEQLARMVSDAYSADKYYKITHDIKLNDTSSENWTENAIQWIWNNNVFSGTVDGGCHTISGLYYDGDKSKVGLFCYAANATLKRIIISDTYIRSSGYGTGALIGDANSGTITVSECYVTETVSIESTYNTDGNKGAGGFIGYGGATLSINGSAFLGTVKAPAFAGAFLGNCWTTATIKNSFAAPEMKFCTKRAISTSSVNNYGTGADAEAGVTRVTVEQMKGLSAKNNMPNLDWLATWKAVEEGFPVLNVGEYDGVAGEVWTGKIAAKFAGGKGTEDEPYLISTGEQLALVLKNLGDTVGKHYKLTHDIYLNDVSNPDWESDNPKPWFWVSAARTGNFNGHLDGDGHVIYGLYLNLEQTSDVVYAGLFPTISDGTVIEKVGLSHSHLKVTNDGISQQSYVGGITGYSFFNLSDSEYEETGVKFPEISQCFGDKTVVLEGTAGGGILAGAPRPANIYDCYFIGEVIGERVGAIVGNSWTTYEGAEVTCCYAATDNADLLGNGRASVTNSATPINYHDNYANSSSVSGMVTQMSLLMMRGDAAKKNMTALDFENVWYALPNGTPVLRIFGTTDKFSNTSDPEPIEVSFVSNSGSECANVYGNPEEPITLPTPTREGYTFGGWYVFRQLDVPFSIDTFPYFDQILYAKWISDGYIQDFENYPNSVYDIGNDYEYYIPGATDYNANYVRNGMAGMHRLGNSSEESDFLVLYEELLTVGKKYNLTFYVATDKAGTSTEFSLVHEDYPDVYDSDSGVEKIKTVTLTEDGKWQKVEFTFIARTQWIAIRTGGNVSIYFDDFMISALSDKIYPVPEKENTTVTNTGNIVSQDTETVENDDRESGKKVVVIKKRRKNNTDTSTGINTALLIAIIAACAVAVVALVTVIIILIKRRKKKMTN